MSTQQVAVRLELPDSVPARAPVAGRLVIANEGDETLSLVTPRYNAALNIVVFDQFWDPVAPESVGKAHEGHERFEVAPGQSVAVALDDLVYTSGTARMAYALGPGSYYVVAVYHPGTDRLPERSSYPLAVASNVVALRVR